MALNMGSIRPVYLIAGGAVVLALLWVKQKGVGGVLWAAGSGAVDLTGAALSAVYNAPAQIAGPELMSAINNSGLVGLPSGDTSTAACKKAIASGGAWDVMNHCTPLDYWNNK